MSHEIRLELNEPRMKAAIHYIAQRIHVPPYMWDEISTLLYFADKRSLENYGYSITGDSYIAGVSGPISITFKKKHLSFFSTPKEYNVEDFLSISDKESLDFAISKYGLKHSDQAWKNTPLWEIIKFEDIIETLDNFKLLIEYLRDPHPGEAE